MLLIDLIAVLSLTGVVLTGVLGGAIGVGMPLLLLVGWVDGPRGGRVDGWIAERGRVRSARAVEAVHVGTLASRPPA